ncbi:hypothetical protein [Bradyrhizobium sp. NAS80.1]|uniref:hypothetical protein n=1 Tax=Bradyrhizobium sp. NAS80.1 TaxID=1680159 RepID=UPI00143E044D|nr:hypothetical protein [Bradyrhizobium sp. NAS80.1]
MTATSAVAGLSGVRSNNGGHFFRPLDQSPGVAREVGKANHYESETMKVATNHEAELVA